MKQHAMYSKLKRQPQVIKKHVQGQCAPMDHHEKTMESKSKERGMIKRQSKKCCDPDNDCDANDDDGDGENKDMGAPLRRPPKPFV